MEIRARGPRRPAGPPAGQYGESLSWSSGIDELDDELLLEDELLEELLDDELLDDELLEDGWVLEVEPVVGVSWRPLVVVASRGGAGVTGQ